MSTADADTISWDDFMRVDLRVGRIVSARVFEQARKPAYVLEVDFGPEIGLRKSSAQVTDLYTPGELVGRLVVGVVNFPPRPSCGSRSGGWCTGGWRTPRRGGRNRGQMRRVSRHKQKLG